MPPSDSKAFHILLLEDEPADAYLVKTALQEARVYCELHHVYDGQQGFDFLRRQAPYETASRPDLILLDLNMPRMNGREFLAAIKTDPEFSDIPVVVLTTSSVERDVETSFKHHAAGYITKPVEFGQLAAAIVQLTDYWFVLTRLPHDKKS